ncbi:MAG: sugar phosphate nucleotidyltransferase [Nannocystaceae bacterium]
MNSGPTLLVLAAGMGNRYGGLKQLDPMGDGGETVLDFSVYDALRSGFCKVVFVIRHAFETSFRRYVEARFGHLIEVEYAFQTLDDLPTDCRLPAGREKPWGTAHAVWCARNHIDAPFAAINADDFYGLDAYGQLAAFLRRPLAQAAPARSALVGFVLKNTLSAHGGVSRGVCTSDDRGQLMGIEELTDIHHTSDGPQHFYADGNVRQLSGNELVSMNMWGLFPPFIEELEPLLRQFLSTLSGEEPVTAECYLPACIDQLVRRRMMTVDVLSTASTWFGVTYPDDKPGVKTALRKLIHAGAYPSRLWD